jgi:hypothetical protein
LELVERGYDVTDRLMKRGQEALGDWVGADVTPLEEHVDALKESGDSVTLELEAGGKAKNSTGKWAQGFEVKRQGDHYVLVESGGTTVGQSLEVGKKKSNASGELTGGLTARNEYTFESKEELYKYLELKEKSVRANPLRAGGMRWDDLRPNRGVSIADWQAYQAFANEKRTAVEFELQEGVELGVGYKVGDSEKGVSGKLGNNKLQAAESQTLRIELAQGRPTAVALTNRSALSASLNAGPGIGNASADGKSRLGEGKLEGSVSLESRLELEGLEGLDPMRPDAALELLRENPNALTSTVKVEGSAAAEVLGKGGEQNGVITIKGQPIALMEAGVYRKLAEGDVDGALRAAGPNATIEGEVYTVAYTGTKRSDELNLWGFGVAGGYDYRRKNISRRQVLRRNAGSFVEQ